MRKRAPGAIVAGALVVLSATSFPLTSPAAATPTVAAATPAAVSAVAGPDGKTNPHQQTNKTEEKRRQAKRDVAQKVITGKAEVHQRGKSRSVQVTPGKWVEYGTEEEARILTFLMDYGTSGPVHNSIPEPAVDNNSTYWIPDFSRQHFLDLFFSEERGAISFTNFYREVSSGRFGVSGDVTDWIPLPKSGSAYAGDTTKTLQDAADVWYDQQIAAGKTPEEITDYLNSFDVWDRNDYDDDGDFAEPDGYIDHFQAVHAGIGQESGGPWWSVWSHRGWAGWGSGGGPTWNKAGGVRIGDTDLWIFDYTIEPENGGLGVFAHEFGHDLGLPDFYDLGGGENSTGFWTAMSQGSWGTQDNDAIGTAPTGMGGQEKLELGWSDFVTVEAGEKATVDLGPAYHATSKPQAVVVNLPDGVGSSTDIGAAASGAKQLYSGRSDNRSATATSPAFTAPDNGRLTAHVAYDIEQDWDYGYLEVSVDGAAFSPVPTSLSTTTNPHGTNLGDGFTGTSGDGGKTWTELTADLSAYAGRSISVRFHYVTDGGTTGQGLKVDDISVGDALSTSIEAGFDGWTLDGFTVVENGQVIDKTYQHYYIAENRTYAGYDVALKVAPYEFSWGTTNPGGVAHFPFEDGVLIWYVNTSQSDNNTSRHPGTGRTLPVDAHPDAEYWSDGSLVRNRTAARDATFGLEPTEPLSLTKESGTETSTLDAPSLPAVSHFDDTDPRAYYDESVPNASVLVAGTGTTIDVVSRDADKGIARIQVNGFPDWNASTAYFRGDQVSYDGHTWKATRHVAGPAPSESAKGWEFVR